MFRLNFKEQLANLVVDEFVDKVADKIFSPEDDLDIPVELENQFIESDVVESLKEENLNKETPLQTAKYQELIDIINKTSKGKMQKYKQEGKPIFSLPSIITIAVFGITGILTQVDQSLSDNIITPREWVQLTITAVGVIGTIAARGGEGRTGVYTPHALPGLNKEDFIDEDLDGLDDRYQ